MQQLLQHPTSAYGWFFNRSELGFYSPPVGSITSANPNKGWCSFTRACCLELLYKLLAAGAIILRGTGMSSREAPPHVVTVFFFSWCCAFHCWDKICTILQSLELGCSSWSKFVVQQKIDPHTSYGFQTWHFIWRLFWRIDSYASGQAYRSHSNKSAFSLKTAWEFVVHRSFLRMQCDK